MRIPFWSLNLLAAIAALLAWAALGKDPHRAPCSPDLPPELCAAPASDQSLLQRKTSKATALTVSSPSSYITSGAVIHLRTHLFERLTAERGGAVHAKWSHAGEQQKWVIERADGSSGQIFPGDMVYLTAHTGNLLAVTNGSEIIATRADRGASERFTVEKSNAEALRDQDELFLHTSTGKTLEANSPSQPDGVQAHWPDSSPWQMLVVELADDVESDSTRPRARSPPVPKRSLLEIKATSDRSPASASSASSTPILSGSTIFLRSHLYERVAVQSAGSVHARWSDKGESQKLVIERTNGTSGQIAAGDVVHLTGWTGNKLAVANDHSVIANWTTTGAWESFTVHKSDDDENTGVYDGDTTFLLAWTGKYLDVNGPDPPDGVQARWEEKGQWQSLVVELFSAPTTTAAPSATSTSMSSLTSSTSAMASTSTSAPMAVTTTTMEPSSSSSSSSSAPSTTSQTQTQTQTPTQSTTAAAGPTPTPATTAATTPSMTTTSLSSSSSTPTTTAAAPTTTTVSMAQARSNATDAQFLIQATFGPTRDSLEELAGYSSYKDWIHAQMEMPGVPLREHYRRKNNPRTYPLDDSIGEPRPSCSGGSRWIAYAISWADRRKSISVSNGKMYIGGAFRTELDSNFSNNGLAPSGGCTDQPSWWWDYKSLTCASQSGTMSWTCPSDDFTANKYCQQTCFDNGYGYEGDDCSEGWASMNYTGYVCVVDEKIGGYLKLSTSSSCDSSFTYMLNPGLWLPNEANIDATQSFTALREGVLLLEVSSQDCNFGEFIRVGGQTYKFDSRLQMVDNAPGSGSGVVTGSCHTVPRAFPKQGGCQLLPSCSSLSFEHASLTLNATSSQLFLAHAQRYIYGVSGLRPSTSPCGGLSRWRLLDCSSSNCTTTDGLSSADSQLIVTAITPELGRTIVDIDVDCSSVPAGSVVAVSSSHYQHVHLNELNTYDFTAWISSHPGGAAAIQQWATPEKGFVLAFPSWHPMERWNEGSGAEIVGTQFIGTWGDDIDFSSLPTVLQTAAVAESLGIGATASEYVENCGSPGEVANDPAEGHKFFMLSVYEDDGSSKWRDLWVEIPFNFRSDNSWYTPQRSDVWVSRAMFGEDQLRQRVAWALSQIVVISVTGLDYSEYTEMWLAFYDIFVRHAFGNYRDILQEVTYSPLMGEYLTFADNKAFDVNGRYPDENYAREIQQLFTIGLWKLNPDGSRVVEDGEDVPTYSNEDIMTFSRVLTGFTKQAERGNVETVAYSKNLIDPMQMKAEYHDGYPKVDLNGDFLGDRLPLCTDRADKAYLAAGAKYRFVGLGALPEPGLSLEAGSALFKALCGAAAASCSYELEVVLPSTLACSGLECDVEELKIVEVAGGHYEFLPEDCVQLFFYAGKTIAHGGDDWWWRRSCANPASRSAGAACCGGSTQDHFCLYPKHYVTLAEASAICQLQGLELCDTKITASTECEYDSLTSDRVWTPFDCSGAIEVHASGKVAWQLDTTTQQNLFQVEWLEGTMPVVSNGACPSGCNVSVDETYCICAPSISSRSVFDSLPSAADLMSRLKIGGYAPTTDCSQGCESEVKAYLSGGSFDETTIFEYNGKYYKNQQQIVTVGGATFRNPPVFMHKMMPSTRGALLEVEALLDHLFTHPNTPVFIGYRLIQRLVTSNPSAAYIKAVGEAFSTGSYDGHTYSGKYGDLAATVAAIFLHPEARMPDDPWEGALREPLVKMMHFLRAMEYRDDDGREIALVELQDTIAQWPFRSPSVFNFFLPDYSPDRFGDGYVGPEFEIFTPPMAINLLNGLMLIVDDGLSWCDNGWGWKSPNCHNGGLTFPTNESEVVLDQLDLLLTGGRMTSSKTAIQEILEEADTPAAGLKKAQKAMLMVPEFNVMGASMPGDARTTSTTETPTEPRSYKATVMLFLLGGADTFNLLVPLNCGLYDEYVAVRQDVALAPESLLSITTSGQTCSEFGIHAGLPILKELYDAGEAAFVANVGGLVEPLTKESYDGNGARCAGLFSHSDQQVAAQTLKCQTRGTSPKGAGGRIADALAYSSEAYRTTSFSVAGTAAWPTGFGVKAEILDQNNGVSRLSQYQELQTVIGNITSVTHGNIYCEEYVQAFNNALISSEQMGAYLEATALQTTMSTESSLASQLKQVAHIIATREDRKAERDVFFVSFGSFDTHASVTSALSDLFGSVNIALESFVTELKAQGVFDQTVIVSHSDFGRTLTPNSGLGTDHAWAGNHVVIGGGLNGGKVFNTFPDSLLEGGEQDAGRGRLIPKYPWESVMVPIGEWMGVASGDTADVFPNLANFNRSQHIIETSSLFRSG